MDDPDTSQVAQLQREVELLRVERDEFLEQLKLKDRKIDDLQHQVQALLRRYYGRSSEKMDPDQRLLFEDLIDKAIRRCPLNRSRRRRRHRMRRPSVVDMAVAVCRPTCPAR
jgi:hypothetical protein